MNITTRVVTVASAAVVATAIAAPGFANRPAPDLSSVPAAGAPACSLEAPVGLAPERDAGLEITAQKQHMSLARTR